MSRRADCIVTIRKLCGFVMAPISVHAAFKRRAPLAILWFLPVLSIVLSTETAAAQGIVRAAGIDLVRLDGLVGVKNAPASIIQTTLLVGKSRVPFSVLSAERFSAVPLEGPGVLLVLGSDHPVILLQGGDKAIGPLASAKPGTRAVIVGNLAIALRSLTVMRVDFPETQSPTSDSPPQ